MPLPTPTPTPAPAESKNPCVICLDEISEPSNALPCRHQYDYVCLLNWLELRQTCPLCNAAVLHVEAFDAERKKYVRHRVDPPRPAPPPLQQRPPHLRRRRNPPPISTDTAILRRRHVYRAKMRSLHVGSNRISRFQNYTPRMVRCDDELQSRAKMFIRRELQVFEWATENAEFVLEYILAIVKTVDLKAASGTAEDMLADFLGRENAGVFCHELAAFLRSPFTSLQSFDAFVQYERPLPLVFDADGLPVETNVSRKRGREEGAEREPERVRRRR